MMYISRDKDGTLTLWSEKPYRDSSGIHGKELDMWNYKCEIPCESMEINWKLFPELKWEDEPLEVEIIAKIDENSFSEQSLKDKVVQLQKVNKLLKVCNIEKSVLAQE